MKRFLKALGMAATVMAAFVVFCELIAWLEESHKMALGIIVDIIVLAVLTWSAYDYLTEKEE